jgi:hypothetical protein
MNEPTAADEVAMWREVADALGVLFVEVDGPRPQQAALFAVDEVAR